MNCRNDCEIFVVPADSGLLANDGEQEFRNVQVDLLFELEPEYVAPQNGTVTVFADGSFEYTPNPGSGGIDSFSYRSYVDVDPGTRAAVPVYSDPALVVIKAPLPPEVFKNGFE